MSDAIHEGMSKIANSIIPLGACSGTDATGGTVLSLTEACMGITAGLCRIADAINNLADAVTEEGRMKAACEAQERVLDAYREKTLRDSGDWKEASQ